MSSANEWYWQCASDYNKPLLYTIPRLPPNDTDSVRLITTNLSYTPSLVCHQMILTVCDWLQQTFVIHHPSPSLVCHQMILTVRLITTNLCYTPSLVCHQKATLTSSSIDFAIDDHSSVTKHDDIKHPIWLPL